MLQLDWYAGAGLTKALSWWQLHSIRVEDDEAGMCRSAAVLLGGTD
jgi:hypothetical protein